MYTVRGFSEAPEIDVIASVLEVSVKDIDAAFGVVPVDSEQRIYCVLADQKKVSSSFGSAKMYEGPWSSPEIEGFPRHT